MAVNTGDMIGDQATGASWLISSTHRQWRTRKQMTYWLYQIQKLAKLKLRVQARWGLIDTERSLIY